MRVDQNKLAAAEALVLETMREPADERGTKRVTMLQLSLAATQRGIDGAYLRLALDSVGVVTRRNEQGKYYCNGPATLCEFDDI